VAQQLLAELHSSKSSAQSLANIAIKDPAITMSLLKMANSAFYGQRDEVTDVQRAIVVIGLRSVRHMVVAAGIGRIFRRPRGRKGYNFDALWTHALGTSVAARLLARRTHALTEAQAGTLGLLHDIGKFAMNVAAPKLTAQLLNPFDGPEEVSGLAKEVMLFGTTHAIYGMRLLEAWKLPHEVARIVEYHHHPAYAEVETLHEDIMRGLSLVHIANQLAKMGGLECGDRTIEHIPDACFEMLGLAPDLEALYDEAMTATFEQARYFVQRAAQDSPGAGR
jgi:putative nucleotidyltransferase with HDIG domain